MIKQYVSYALGAFGHDAFYATLNTYFAIFVTSALFVGKGSAAEAGIVTSMVVIIRLIEIAFDPMIGGMVDNTDTKIGKFKPWQLLHIVYSNREPDFRCRASLEGNSKRFKLWLV